MYVNYALLGGDRESLFLCDRITKLRNTGNLEAAAYAHLKHLGELKRPYLTLLEEKLLRLLEQEYVDA